MSARQQMNDLAERRRLLAVESDLHRALVQMECAQIRSRFAGLRSLRDQLAGHKPLLVGAAGIAGLLTMRHWRRAIGWAPVIMRALRWFRVWQAGSSRHAD